MRSQLFAAFAVSASLCSMVACSDDESTGVSPPAATGAQEPQEPEETGEGGGGTGDGGGGGTKDAGAKDSGGGTKDSGGPVTCTAPAITATKLLGELSATEKGQTCDYSACPFGGYGKSKACADGVSVKAPASQAACVAQPTFTNCAELPVGDLLACQAKLNADPCKSLEVLSADPACASTKACLF